MASESCGLPVDLQAVADRMSMGGDLATAYIDRKTGELALVSKDDRLLGEFEDADEPSLPERQVEAIAFTRKVLESDDFIELPSQYEIHEYSIMERFCHGVDDDRARIALEVAISEREAFRRFKDAVHRFGIADDWYAYRGAALRKVAVDFLTAEGIPFTDSEASHKRPGTEAD